MKRLRKISSLHHLSCKLPEAYLGKIEPLRDGYYEKLDFSVGGDAPKNFIRVYEYGIGKKQNPKSWPRYIAKVGHKWYPNESITEYLLNQVGVDFGLNMAESSLKMVHGQLRFLSKYFLRENQILTHGAEIYSAYLNEDSPDFIDQIEKERLSKEWLTFQFTINAIKYTFKSKSPPIIDSFIKMLAFDAFVGNNDRHFYNWGVVEDIGHKNAPFFSPIYDTARGLFWNIDDKRVSGMMNKKGQPEMSRVEKYAKKSMPKIGWEGMTGITHFEFIQKIAENYPNHVPACKSVINPNNYELAITCIEKKFQHLFSEDRLIIILACLKYRFDTLSNILS